MTRSLLITLVVGSFVAVGCSSQPRVTGNPVLVNPEDVSPEIGGTDWLAESIAQ